MTHLFDCGELAVTPGAMELGHQRGLMFLPGLLDRHLRGDWGDVTDEAKVANDLAVMGGERILSAYGADDDPDQVYVITEANRSVTTMMRCNEY